MNFAIIEGGKRQVGFTLLELLISLVILSFIALGAYQALQVVTQSRKATMSRSEELRALIRAVNLLETDLRQIVMNPLPEDSDARTVSFSTKGDKGEAALDFVRQGWINSSGRAQSRILRVRWQLTNGDLQRIYWDYYKNDNAHPHIQDVITGIVSIKVAYLDSSGGWRDDWVQGRGNKKQSSFQPPRALKVDLHHERYGDIQRLVLLPEVAEDPNNDGVEGESPSGKTE